jgi:hypothetical protein
MNTARDEASQQPGPTAISVWEDDGGACGRTRMDQHFGRRIEADRTWTIYHVYTGVPASADGRVLAGLSRSDATDGMLFLNNRNSSHRAHRNSARAKPRLGFSTFLWATWRRTGGLSWH